ncbi:AlpA family phage regulatory protein [Aeromonas jandaei]|uniref:helix-turn-helix transcriptional regulator n=1 Tax=Aeromonas jandaei TaxID=650 RepID=UPI001C5AE148|nr:AlpA family phage regulatory protein [Aeromonas jandaei]MBW3760320.1 AlpA family phage regulatory protein [Aeromonas jandaei]
MTKKTTRSAYIKGIEHLNADSHVAGDAKPHASKAPSYYFLLLKDVLSRIPVSKTTWYDGIKKGIYPKGYSLGGRRVAWRSCDIEDLMQKLVGEI